MKTFSYAHCVLQYEKTVDAVFLADDSIETLVELLQIYREKGCSIFTRTCMVLGMLGYDRHRRIVRYKSYDYK